MNLSLEADVLVVDACASPPPSSATPARAKLIEKLHGFHASPQDCVDMAKEANGGEACGVDASFAGRAGWEAAV